MQATRNRKSVLGDNPFEPRSSDRPPSAPSTADAQAPADPAPVAQARTQGSASAARAKDAKRASAPSARGKSASSPKAQKPAAPTRSPASPKPKKAASARVDATARPAAADHGKRKVDDNGDAAAADEVRQTRAVDARIREIESQIDAIAGKAVAWRENGDDSSEHERDEARERASRARGRQPSGGSEGGMFDAAKELLSSDYYLRQWGRMGMRNRSDAVDEFGYDPKYDARVRPVLELLYSKYFRATAEGIEHVPATGRALIVVNHSGTFPYDGVMLKTAVRKEQKASREVRWLSEDQVFYLPFVGSFMNRLGSVRACQENAERLLAGDNLVAVFPEGAKGMGRLYRDRYKLQRFGRGGFIRLCLRTRTPIVPCVILGAEESMPLMMRIEYLTGPLGLPYLPITPTFPLLGPLGLLPAPTRWSFVFGPPIDMEGYGPESADDSVLVGRLTERVRATMQTMIDSAVSSRRSVWFG